MIGLAMLGFAPLTIAAVTAERRRAYRVLRTAMEQDDLTGALRRGEFLRRGEVALTELSANAPQVGLLDLRMRGMDGLSVLRHATLAIRRHEY